jgi:hypothetical protein
MTVKLNKKGLSHARALVRRNRITHDDRDDWSEHAPGTDENNTFIAKNGMADYARWHLGEDTDETEGTRGRYLFPYGDFERLHRCAVVSGESRAAQHDHPEIERAFRELLAAIDKKSATDKKGKRRKQRA